MKTAKKLPIIAFRSSEEFNKWLSKNHSSSNGIWLKFSKKTSSMQSVSPQEALEIALCYGWIDGQINKFDDKFYLVKHTPRTKHSIWSKRNRDIVEELIAAKKMRPAGLQQVEAAKADGRWEKVYDSPKNMQVPKDFLNELKKNPKAEAFYKTLNKANQYAIGWRLQTAKKAETRARRMKKILTMMTNGEKFH